MNKTLQTAISTLLFIVVISIMQIRTCNLKKELNDSSNTIKAISDTAKIYKDKNGIKHIQIAKLESDRKTLIEIAKKKDAEIAKILKDKDIKTVIKYKYIVQKGDSVLLTDSCTIDTMIGDKWLTLKLKTEGKKLFTDVSVKNELIITDKQVRDKWWKSKYSVIDIANKNPYAKDDLISNYSVKVKQRDVKKWFLGGFVAGAIGTLFILK